MIKKDDIDFIDSLVKKYPNPYKRGEDKTAFKKYMPLAKKGDAEAQHHIGHLYHFWHEIAEYSGTSSPLYNSDKYFTENFKESFKWTKRAAEQGHSAAEWSLGHYYELPYCGGIYRDIKKAVRWYRRSAKQGNALGQSSLGRLYLWGSGVTKNYKKAVEWIRRAAEQGDDESQTDLGELYEKGQGVQQDNIMAFMWFDIAAKAGEFYAIKGCRRLKKILTPSQLAQARKLSKQCVKNNYKGC